MDWKQILLPQRVRVAHKEMRWLGRKLSIPCQTFLLKRGWPAPLADFLADGRAEARVVLFKQGILSVSQGTRFLRYASTPRAAANLEREFASWRHLREHGLASIVEHRAELHRLRAGVLLATELMHPISKLDQLAVTTPIIEAIVAAAAKAPSTGLPPTITAGLELACKVFGGSLRPTFISEAALHECFARPLLTGISHQDLHWRNVMRDCGGRPVLIDLKSCSYEQVISLDLLLFAAKYLAARDRRNIVEWASKWPELRPVLDFIDLPCQHWGPILVLHALGLHASRREGNRDPNAVARRLLFNSLTRDWRTA
jgi:hypothetical protein